MNTVDFKCLIIFAYFHWLAGFLAVCLFGLLTPLLGIVQLYGRYCKTSYAKAIDAHTGCQQEPFKFEDSIKYLIQ